MPIDPSQGSALAGGIPTAPSTQGPAPTPQPQAPGAVPAGPDGASMVQDALKTIMTFALAQKDQGDPAIQQAMVPLMEALAGGGAQQQLPPEQGPPIEAAPPPQAVPGGQVPLNA